MDDALGVRGAERFGDFLGDADDFVGRQAAVEDAVAQGFAFEQLHDEIGIAVLLADVEDGADVGMVEGGGGACFAEETLAHAGHGVVALQQFNGDFAMQACVPGAVHMAHATAAQARLHLVRSEPPACLRTHDCRRLPSAGTRFNCYSGAKTVVLGIILCPERKSYAQK